jgi:hypothetical protein
MVGERVVVVFSQVQVDYSVSNNESNWQQIVREYSGWMVAMCSVGFGVWKRGSR